MKRVYWSAQVVLGALFTLVLSAPTLQAAVIDLFVGSPQIAERTTLGGSVVAAPPVALSGGLFDQRILEVRYGVQRLQVTDGKLAFDVLDPPPGYSGNARGYPLIGYTSLGGANLLGDGSTAVRMIFDAFSSRYPYGFDLYMRSGATRQSVGIVDVRSGVSSSTSVDIPFDRFDRIDLTSVNEIGIDGIRFPIGTVFSITGIYTVPEPSSVLLVCLLGSAGIFLRGRTGRITRNGRTRRRS